MSEINTNHIKKDSHLNNKIKVLYQEEKSKIKINSYKDDSNQSEKQINENKKKTPKIIPKRIIKNKTKRKFNNFNNKNKYCFTIIIIFLIFHNFSYQFELGFKQRKIYSLSSNITIKIQGIDIQSIFYGSGGSFPLPNEIYINDIKQNDIKDKYNFNKYLNIVKLVWLSTFSQCNYLFKDCSNIIEIDFSQFSFSNGLYGYQMFYKCTSLTSVNFRSSETIKIYNLIRMFSYCESLSSLDITKFDVSSITDTQEMFRGCRSLISIDLSNFSHSNFENGQYMFYDCPNLIYVNLKAHYCPSGNVNYFFSGSKNIAFCHDCYYTKPLFERHGCALYDCSTNWRKTQKKINLANNACVNDCSETSNNKYLYLSKCYVTCPVGTYNNNNYECEVCHQDCKACDKKAEVGSTNCKSCKWPDKYLKYGNCVSNCTNGFYLDENDNSIKICKCDLNKCYKCSKESFNKNLCITCNEGYYPKENDINNIDPFIDCYQSPKGYYLDNNDNNPIYKHCYESCSSCNIFGNAHFHNCNECKPDYHFELNLNGHINCYIKCKNYYYYNKNINKYYCTEFLKCPEAYNKLIYNKSECINKCEEDEEYKYEFRKSCYKECPEGTTDNNYFCELNCPEEKPFEMISKQECVKYCSVKDLLDNECILNYKSDEEDYEQKAHDIMIQNVEHDFISPDYDTTHLKEGEEDIIEFRKILITLTTTKNQKDSTNYNNTFIDLKECETSLRQKYSIPGNEELFIKKIDVIQDEMKIPKIEYDIYYKFNSSNSTHLKKVDISICNNNRIELSLPIEISEDLDKLNISGDYYNDICYPTTSETGTDITLNDRRNDFVENNETVCQDDCYLAIYDNVSKRAKCSCKPKESAFSFIDMNINKTKLYQQFTDVKNIINLNIIFCYKELFCKEGIIKNINFYLIIPFITFHLVVIIIFYSNQKKKLDKKIKNISFGINNWHLIKEENKKDKSSKKKINKLTTTQNTKNKNMASKNKKHNKNKIKNKHYPPKKKNLRIQKQPKINLNNQINNFFNSNMLNSNTQLNKKKETIKKAKKIMELNYEEKNKLPYELTIKIDKRTFCQDYLSLILTRHILIFSFYYKGDYNSKIIKIDQFLLVL